MNSLTVAARVQLPAGNAGTYRTLEHHLRFGMLVWAEHEVASTRVPAVDLVDYWEVKGFPPIGVVPPRFAQVFHFGERRLDGGGIEFSTDELLDIDSMHRRIAKVVLFERLRQGAHPVA